MIFAGKYRRERDSWREAAYFWRMAAMAQMYATRDLASAWLLSLESDQDVEPDVRRLLEDLNAAIAVAEEHSE